jgi:hypothetical protein
VLRLKEALVKPLLAPKTIFNKSELKGIENVGVFSGSITSGMI